MPLDHHPVREHARVEVAADQPQHSTVRDPFGQPSHQHVVVDPVKELLQVDIHHDAAAFLHVGLCATHRVVRPPSGPEAVARIREGRVEQRLQDLQQGLLDEPVEHGWDAELALAPARLRDRHPSHRLRLVAPREEFLAKPRPVHAQMIGQRFDCHPVDAGTARILSNTLQCGQKVPAFARLLHQVAGSWALVSVPSRGRFHTQARPLRLHRASRLCARTIVRRLWHGIPEGRGRLALPIVRPFAAGAATMASADFSLRRPCGPRHPFGRRARPPRVRTSAFAAPPPDLRRRALVTRASRSLARSPCPAPPHIRFLFVGPQPRSTLPSRRPRGPALCASLRSP